MQVDKKAFGARVTQRRVALGISQTALAESVGMKQQGIVSIESGHVERPRKLRELAAALKTTEQWLLWHQGPQDRPGKPAEIIDVPLISWVSAGKLADPRESQVPAESTLQFTDLGSGDFFALRVKGDSMDRWSPEGSVIVVDRADRVLVSGKPYVFSVKGETTYKLWHSGPEYLDPHSTNSSNKPVFFKKRQLEVIGRVRRSVLDL
jgi:SOS-response transcriptional repressor LexA